MMVRPTDLIAAEQIQELEEKLQRLMGVIPNLLYKLHL